MRKFLYNVQTQIIAFLLVVSFVAGTAAPVFVQKAEAQWAVFDAANTIQNTVTAGATTAMSALQSSLSMKELTLDGLAWAAINIVLQEMSKSIVTWINSGFKGSPMFVTDLNKYLTDIADIAAEGFIWGAGLQGLCSPFKLNVQMALDLQYRQSRGDYKAQCTLSTLRNNIEGFANDAAYKVSNWDQWFEVTMNPQNNVYGAMALANNGLTAQIVNAKGEKMALLDFGKGFLSMENCETVSSESGDQENCTITTPGTVIEEQLNVALGSPTRRIELADEINEIVAALFGQLTQQIFSGAGGLLGMTQSGYGSGSGTYYSRLEASLGNAGMQLSTYFDEPMRTEEGIRTSLLRERSLIQDLRTYKQNSCLQTDSLTSSLDRRLTQVEAELRTVDSSIARIKAMDAEIIAAQGSTNIGPTYTRLFSEIQEMTRTGALHSPLQAIQQNMQLDATSREVSTHRQQIDQSCTDYGGGGP